MTRVYAAIGLVRKIVRRAHGEFLAHKWVRV